MAIQTDRSRPADAEAAAISDGLLAFGKRVTGQVIDFTRRIGLYEFLTYGPLIRLVAKTLLRRIIFANMIGLVILLSGIFYLSQYHAWLIEAKRDSLRAQGEVIAAAIAANATREKDTGRIVLNPDMLPETEGERGGLLRDENIAAMQLSIPPERVAPLFKGGLLPADIRARVYASDGVLIVDSDQLLSRGQLSAADPTDVSAQQERPKGIKTTWTRFMSWMSRRQLPVYREIGMANGMAYPEVRVALTGGHDTAMVLVTDRGEQIVSVATPINYRGVTQGALLLSSRPGVIDDILQEERNVVLSLALTALAATLIASVLLYRTIAGPMRRLSEAADSVSRSIGAGAKLPELAGRSDEVGQMASAFRAMTASLYQRIEASERFAREVAHELKNPLTAARSTAESLAYAKTPEIREELVRQIQGELSRLNKLITDVSNVSRLDAELAYGETEIVDIREVLHGVMDIFQDRFSADTRKLVLNVQDMPHYPEAFIVRAHEARLGRVITNLLDNALSFSPEGGTITVSARRTGPEIVVVVDDEGPGIPPDKLESIFERFYSDRPQSDSTLGKNSGLGLSITRDIVDAYGGSIEAVNRFGSRGGRQ
ncbi:MAG: HAMP domain-containing protein [Rhodospirillales bacterium]|nr:HAMP domain-containing protein [Rhodospirillales bacterium]